MVGKPPNWLNCEPIKVCKHSVKTCSNKHQCQIQQPGLLLDVLLPTGPQEGTLPLPSPWVSEEKAAAPSTRVLAAEPSPGASRSPEPLGGYVPMAPGGPVPGEGLHRSCLMPSHGPRRDVGSSPLGIRVCFYPHLCPSPSPSSSATVVVIITPESGAIFCTLSSSITLIITLNIPGATGTD